MLRCGLASDGVYMCPLCCQKGGSLLHCPSTLTPGIPGRYISVALSLESPPPDVIRHPCPVKPGLSSPGTFRSASRDHLSYLQATILPQNAAFVNYFSIGNMKLTRSFPGGSHSRMPCADCWSQFCRPPLSRCCSSAQHSVRMHC